MFKKQLNEGFNPDFDSLFVLDLANNHQGSIEHGLNIIRDFSEVVRRNNVRAAIKFQYRDLDSLIHPEHRESKENKHIPRFIGTRLNPDEFKILVDEVKRNNLLTACTPFDEASVDLIEKHGFDLIKIASCSAKDKPLLKRISESEKPIIFSTAGAELKDIDYAVNLFETKGRDFALMHCVAIYPTPSDKLELNQIDFLRNRYGNIPVGFSTHEHPNDILAVQLAIAKGAKILERHIGKETLEFKLNSYSSTPEQIEKWIKSAKEAKKYVGQHGKLEHTKEELESLQSLERGVYLARAIKKGERITRNDVFFAMPLQKNQMNSGSFNENIIADVDYEKNKSLNILENIINPQEIKAYAIQTTKSLLRSAKIELGTDYDAELSHHYGIEKFLETGMIMINCINRDYCKKLLIQIPDQSHPEHYHIKKEETFHLLYGKLDIIIDGMKRTLKAGDKILIEPGQKHSFSTKTGAIIEEISSKYEKGGSVYTDQSIFSSNPDTRKTYLEKL